MSTELTVIQRAQVALKASDHEPQLIALAAKHRDIMTITNPDGLRQAHAARIELKKARLAIEAAAEEAREDANAFSRACVAEQKRLIAIVKPEEDRLQSLQSAYEERIAAEKKAREDAERKRLDILRDRIADIRVHAIEIAHCSAVEIDASVRDLVALEIGEDYQEMRSQAEAARVETLERLRAMHAKAVERERIAAELKAAQEAAAKRLEDLAAELAAKQAEQDKRDAEERERVAAERAELARLRAEQEKRDAEERAKIAAEREAARKAQEEFDRNAAAERAEEIRMQRDAEEKARADRQAKEDAERAARAIVDAEIRERQRKEQAAIDARIAELAAQKAAEERASRQREIDSATLYEAAVEAHALLVGIAPAHIATAKLRAAISRHAEPEALKAAA